jgi:hypothetical protein
MKHHDYYPAEERLFRTLKATDPAWARAHGETDDFIRRDHNAPPPTDLGYYIPTGYRTLDAILANARPPIYYGGVESANVAAFNSALKRGEPVPFGSLWILQPMPEAFRSEADRVATLAHELIHWTQEAGRMSRPAIGQTLFERAHDIKPDGYAEEELIAEIGSALLLDAIGADPQYQERAAYLLNWTVSLGSPAKAEAAWRAALPKAEAAVDYLLQFAEGVS